MTEAYLCDFHHIDPPFWMSQEKGLEWILEAHIKAEKKKSSKVNSAQFLHEIKESMAKVCCKPEAIGKRYSAIADFHTDWDEMSLYSQSAPACGEGMGKRTQMFQEIVTEVFETFYPENHPLPPEDLIHVTCTGYQSPSAAQNIVSKRKWGRQTRVIHLYHMGCLAAVPAIRLGMGFNSNVEVVHTEISSLHFNPSLHAKDQLVGQSLFADGFIKYSLSPYKKNKPSLKICALHEEIIENTEKVMEWICEDWGMKLTLSKEIPKLIHANLPNFLKTLFLKAEKKMDEMEKMLFAIHPGGPKIIDLIQRQFDLPLSNIVETKEVLFHRGNISSATIPHIWEKILQKDNYPKKTFIVSLAFGPGLCIQGAILEKV